MGQALASHMSGGSSQGADRSSDGPQNPETAWWCRLLARIVGTVGAIVAFVLGIFTCVTLTPLCVVSGLLLMLSAVIVLVIEAPICCTFLDVTKPIAAFAERRTYFQKAIIYVVLSITPLAMCFDFSTAFGCGPIFATGVIYGIMGLGKKFVATTLSYNRILYSEYSWKQRVVTKLKVSDNLSWSYHGGDRDQVTSTAGASDRPLGSSRPDDTRVGLIENEDAQRIDQSPFQGSQGYPK